MAKNARSKNRFGTDEWCIASLSGKLEVVVKGDLSEGVAPPALGDYFALTKIHGVAPGKHEDEPTHKLIVIDSLGDPSLRDA